MIFKFCFLASVKAMLLIIDCKYKLIQKYQPSAANGMTKVGFTQEREGLLESEFNGVAIMQPDEPSLPVVSISLLALASLLDLCSLHAFQICKMIWNSGVKSFPEKKKCTGKLMNR